MAEGRREDHVCGTADCSVLITERNAETLAEKLAQPDEKWESKVLLGLSKPVETDEEVV